MNLGYLAAADRFGDASILGAAIGSIQVRTAPGLPDVTLYNPSAPPSPVTDWVLKQVGPQVVVDGNVVSDPYGQGTVLGPVLVWGSLVTLLAAAFAAGRRSVPRPRALPAVAA